MADIPVAQVVPMQDNDNLPIAREYVPPFPVSMFDLVPGRRYRISNREITPAENTLLIHSRYAPPVVPLNNYQEGQHTFIATFITLTTQIQKNVFSHNMNAFHPIQFFDDINHSSGIIENNRELGWRRGLQEQLGYTNVYPIFSYEQGLTQHQLEDLTLDLDMICAKSSIDGTRIPFPGGSTNIARIKKQLSGVINQELTWNRPMTEPLPGLLYYGHDTHSGFGRGEFYPDGAKYVSILKTPTFINRNFRYYLFKHFLGDNARRGMGGKVGGRWWWDQYPYPKFRFSPYDETGQLLPGGRRRQVLDSSHPGVPDSARALGDECFADLYFNDRLDHINRLFVHGNALASPPPITRLQNHILKNTRPMIILPGYWSIIDDNNLNQPPAVTGVVRPAIERGRRRLDGGRRIKTKKKRKKQKTKRKKRRKMRARAK